MMKTSLFYAGLSLFAPAALGQGLVEVLNSQGFTSYAARLQSNPSLLQRFTENNDVTIYAPVNSAFQNSSEPRRSLHKRQDDSSAEDSQQGCHDGPPEEEGLRKRQEDPMQDSTFRSLRTFLVNPGFVNLGPNRPGRVVQNFAAPEGGESEAGIEISSGGGATSRKVSGPFKYNKGIIYGVDSFFTLPKPLEPTLREAGLTTFLEKLSPGDLNWLSNTPAMIIFAPGNSTAMYNIREHVVENTLGYSPELRYVKKFKSAAGNQITITLDDAGSLYANGVKILKSDLIMKNGVVHSLEKPLGSSSASTPTTAGPAAQFTGGASGTRLNMAIAFVCALTTAISVALFA